MLRKLTGKLRIYYILLFEVFFSLVIFLKKILDFHARDLWLFELKLTTFLIFYFSELVFKHFYLWGQCIKCALHRFLEFAGLNRIKFFSGSQTTFVLLSNFPNRCSKLFLRTLRVFHICFFLASIAPICCFPTQVLLSIPITYERGSIETSFMSLVFVRVLSLWHLFAHLMDLLF